VNRVRRRTDGRKGKKPSCKAKTAKPAKLSEWTVSDGIWEECKVECRKTPRVYRIRRPLGGELATGQQDRQVQSSENRDGRWLDGEWIAHQGGKEYINVVIYIYFLFK
jgi:hypothetical protein